jgi:hypothetical protein
MYTIETLQNDVWLSLQQLGLLDKTNSFGDGTLFINEDALNNLLSQSSPDGLVKRSGITKKNKKRLHQKPAVCGYGSCVSSLCTAALTHY